MIVVAVILLVLQTKLTIASGDGKEHVHFKIYVPEIIKHHIHTKTVFIHVHEPKKKSPPKKKKEHVESHHDDWNIWSGYNNYEEHGSRKDNGHSAVRTHQGHHEGHRSHYTDQGQDHGYATPYEGLVSTQGHPPPPISTEYPTYYRPQPEPPIPHYDDYQGPYQPVNNQNPENHPVPVKSVFPNGVTGYSYPPQYEVQENVLEDIPQNSYDPEKNSHDESHSKQIHTESGHIYTNELNNYYNDKHEESSEAISMESKEVEESKDRDSYRYVGDEYLTTKMVIR